ncbi:hypothetical protein [Solidesulfovibrio sp. C21]|uniref:hypothetical protein n=1 Tax=Solidesulfovibrio sp. C21 TaxID=3398613 RepID=UPI0039FC5862
MFVSLGNYFRGHSVNLQVNTRWECVNELGLLVKLIFADFPAGFCQLAELNDKLAGELAWSPGSKAYARNTPSLSNLIGWTLSSCPTLKLSPLNTHSKPEMLAIRLDPERVLVNYLGHTPAHPSTGRLLGLTKEGHCCDHGKRGEP